MEIARSNLHSADPIPKQPARRQRATLRREFINRTTILLPEIGRRRASSSRRVGPIELR
jgi:hypothetical protein